MVSKHDGSCLCGEVRYTMSGGFDSFYLCHCSRCRKGTGSAHGANLFSAKATLTWLSGQGSITSYRLPDTRHTRSFCSVCGSALPFVGEGGVVVPAGSLDTDVSQVPTGNIFMGSRALWDQDLDLARHFEELPL